MNHEHDSAVAGASDALYPREAEAVKRPASKVVQALPYVIGGVIGVALVAFDIPLPDAGSLPQLAGWLGLCVLLLWLQVIAHEAGHAFAGVLAGKRLVGAGIGPLRLERGTGGWMLRWGGAVRGLAGFAVLLPADGRGDSRGADIAFVLGGPLVNLVSAAAALAVLLLAPPAGATASVALWATAITGALLGIINLVPYRPQGWHTDGLALLELLRDTPASRVMRVQQHVIGLSMAGVRPRDWPLAQLDVAGDLPAEVVDAAHLLRLMRALDSDDRPAADAAALQLAAAYPSMADGRRQGVALMLATYAVRAARDPALLAAWRPLCEGGLLDFSPQRLWLDAEAAAMAGDPGTARAFAAESRAALPRIHDPASVTVLRERLDALDAQLAATA